MSNRIDKTKLNHWLNIRKTSIDVLNGLLSNKLNHKISLDDLESLDNHSIEIISETLSIPKASLVSEQINASADGSVRLTLNYIGHS